MIATITSDSITVQTVKSRLPRIAEDLRDIAEQATRETPEQFAERKHVYVAYLEYCAFVLEQLQVELK